MLTAIVGISRNYINVETKVQLTGFVQILVSNLWSVGIARDINLSRRCAAVIAPPTSVPIEPTTSKTYIYAFVERRRSSMLCNALSHFHQCNNVTLRGYRSSDISIKIIT